MLTTHPWKAEAMTLLGARSRTAALGLSFALVGSIALAGCSGGSEPVAADRTPQEMMELAQRELAQAQTVEMTLKTDDLPAGVNGLVKAEGTATKAPAFEGDINVSFNSLAVTVPVRALDGKVWAIIPGSTEWATIDPSEYGAPDPATLIDEADGFGGLLGKVKDLKHSKDELFEGDEVATYTGTVAGAEMKKVMPSADDAQDFAGTFSLDGDGELHVMKFTGVFYKGQPSLTYQLAFTDYDDELKKIVAP